MQSVTTLHTKDATDIAENPIFFERNRVQRVYKGGKLFHDFLGDADEDSFFPEEWIASDVIALNNGSHGSREGISRVRGTGIYFDELLLSYREKLLGDRKSFGVLVKLLDSAVRLPVQVHPDKRFAKKYFGSDYGKTEAWIILATRGDACIYYGFKKRIDKKEFISRVEASETDKDSLVDLVEIVPVEKGDVWLIPPRTVHAIGSGCLILEIQESTDFTIQPEAWCADYKLSKYEKYLGLSREEALECFDFALTSKEAIKKGKKMPKIYRSDNGICSTSLIDETDTDCFLVNLHKVENGRLEGLKAPAVYIVTEGEGLLCKDGATCRISRGDYFFLPFCIDGRCAITTEGFVQVVECLPPKP